MVQRLEYICCCADITQDQWDLLMQGVKPCSYKRLFKQIKRDCPELTYVLTLDMPPEANPYHNDCFYKNKAVDEFNAPYGIKVYTHSATEYFFRICLEDDTRPSDPYDDYFDVYFS